MAIIYLYESTATDFRYNGQPLPKAYEVVVEYTINDSYFVTFKHPLDDAAVYKRIKKDMIVTVHTPDGLQPMRIMDETKHMDSVEYEAWPLLYADMRTKLVKPLALRGQTGTSAINYFVQNLLIDTPFDFSSNISETHDYHTQNTEDNENNPHALFNALEVLKDIVNRWNGELQINGYDIRMVNRLGKNTDALLYEKKNISEFTDEESIQGVVTRLYGISEWEEESDVEGEEPIKHTINTMVESPLINAYSGIVFEKQYTNNDMRTEEQLKSWLNLKFTTENIDKPTRSITAGTNIVDGEEIHIGDTLVLKYIKHDVDMSIRMVGYKYDGYADRYISVDLGDVKDTYTGNMQNIIDDNRNSLSNQMKQQYASIVNSLGEKMIYSVNEPSGNFEEGDVWFDQQGGMYFWDEESGMWIDHPYNKNKKLVEEQVDALQEEVAQASKSAEEADKLANEAIGKAGESSDLAQAAKDAAERAESNADAAGNKAADALAQSGSAVTAAEEAIQSIATFEPLVAGAVTKADDAIAKANNIPITIDNTITAKGLVTGDWVTAHTDDITGEFNYALASVRGSVPDVILGVEWSRISDPSLSRTNYVEEFANLEDYQLKAAEYDLSIDGLTASIQSIETNKLDSSTFNTFKSNEYQVTVDGLTTRLSNVETDKLDGSTFTSFRDSEYQVTVDGLSGEIQSLENNKLDHVEFIDFKSNEYQMTVDGFNMALSSVSGAIRDLVLGVEWPRDPNPEMRRTRDAANSASAEEFETLLADYNFNAAGWNATNAYVDDNKTSINSLISNADGWSQTISYVDGNRTAINETIAQVDYYKQTILGADGENIAQLVMTDSSFITRISEIENRTEDVVLGVEWERVSSPRMVRIGYMEDWASSQIAQLSDNINLKVSKGDVLSQINIEAGRTLVQTGKLYLDADTVVFSGSAFIPSASIINLTADKITTGQLDASKVKVVNIDANQITSNASNFVKTYWNSAAGGAVQINGNGILSTASDGSQTYIQNGIVGTRNPEGATIGQIGYINTGTIATYSLRTSWGSHFELRQRSNADKEYTMLRAENGATNFFINARNGIYLSTSSTGSRVNIDSEVRILNGNRLYLEDARIVNPYGIFLNHGGEFYTLSGGGSTRLGFGSELQFRQGATSSNIGTQKMMIDSTRNYMYQTLNMQGNSITESPSVSDGRLKDISGDRVDNDLQKLLSVKYVNFMWKEDGKPDFGFIAQQIQGFASEIVRDVNGGWLGYDQASYTHLIGHALQQHAGITANQLTQLRQENEALHDRIAGLEVRITELERAM